MDHRRRIPGTDQLLAEPALERAAQLVGRSEVKRAIHAAQQRARAGEIAPEDVTEEITANLRSPTGLHRVLNATGVLLHTNLGRAPLSDAARRAIDEAAGTTDVELDRDTGGRGERGAEVLDALRTAVPPAQAAHVVNNGAAALSLAATALARDREIVLARGEMVEIGDGFRIPELLESTGARLREVGTTNRVHIDDYRRAIGPETGFVLKVHPSNFVISGFTSSVGVDQLAELDAPLLVDIGSGLLAPHPRLPNEPDASNALATGADLVTASGDKLLGGPQAGLILGTTEMITTLRRHPLARALRVDKLTLAALHATITGPATPVERALRTPARTLRQRAAAIAETLAAKGIDASARPSAATVGGGGAPGVELASTAVALPTTYARRLRHVEPPVLARIEHEHCLIDLLTVAPDLDDELIRAVLAAGEVTSHIGDGSPLNCRDTANQPERP